LFITEPPGPPRGPLEVSGMTKTSFTIKWEPPENDGGTPITDYVIEMKEISKKSWQKVNMFFLIHVNKISFVNIYMRFFRLRVQREMLLMSLYQI